jgi:hypothetical protein
LSTSLFSFLPSSFSSSLLFLHPLLPSLLFSLGFLLVSYIRCSRERKKYMENHGDIGVENREVRKGGEGEGLIERIYGKDLLRESTEFFHPFFSSFLLLRRWWRRCGDV